MANIRLLKIDVEGFEASVLEGASYTLREQYPERDPLSRIRKKGAYFLTGKKCGYCIKMATNFLGFFEVFFASRY